MAEQPPSQPPPPTQPPPPSQPPPPQPGMPPPAAGYTPPAGPSGPRSGFWRRVGAAVVDGILVAIPVNILAALFGLDTFSVTGTDAPAYQALSTLAGWAYGTYFEGSGAGQTVGKKLLNIRVIDFATGGPLGYPKAFVRQLVKLVSGIVCGLGYLWMLWDREKQTWHDKVATTVVVPTDAYPVSSWPG
jgi:uncharacterized RDD family membrane protein YckC